MANIMSLKKLKNHVSRNGFDLSRKNIFSAKVGELLPVCCIECLPGDKHTLKHQHFTRTMPVNTAAYTRIREYYDWFFVPTNLLWNKFNTFVTQMTDNNQHATSINSSEVLTDQHPYFTSVNQAWVFNQLKNTGKKNFFGLNRSDGMNKLMQYLDYGNSDVLASGQQPYMYNAGLNPFPLLAYQKIYSDYFRNSQWEKANASTFNIDYMTGKDSLQLPISDLDFDNETMFDLRYCNWNKDYFMGLLPNTQYGDAAAILLGDDSSSSSSEVTRFSADIGGADYPQHSAGGMGWTSMVASYDSPVFIPAKDNTARAKASASGSMDYSLELTSFVLEKSNVAKLKTALGLSDSSSVQSAFTILALRQAEAKQKWAEITQSQQQDYKSQMAAHFDVKVSDAYSERCKYVGGSVSNLDISAVENTNLVDDASSARIAGKGVGVGDSHQQFETQVHGYLMCIYHAVPILDFANNGVAKHNLKTMVTDYAIPEFDRTGMVSVPVVELTNTWIKDFATSSDNILGYAPRYYDYKTAYDKVHGAFMYGGLDAWVAPFDDSYITTYLNGVKESGLAAAGILNYNFFKVNPAVLNPIFVANVDSTVATDQLLINCAFDIKSVRNLDVDGLPY